MQTRTLGTQGLAVSAIGLGCMGMSEFYGTADDSAASIKLIHEALARGLNFFDSADMYGPFTNEELLGRALSGKRKDAVIATKFGFVRDDRGGWHGVSGRPDYIKTACDASLRRLQVETIDLYYQHRVDPTVPIEDTVGAMADLVRAGKVRYLGLSEAGAETIRRAHREHPISVLQTEYSLWSRDPEAEHFALCRELGIGFVAYSPLGRGFLTGSIRKIDDLKADDFRRSSPRFLAENFQRNLDVVDQVQAIAKSRECSAAQIALAWVLSRNSFIVPIPGTTKLARLEENLGAADITLSADEIAAIEAVAPKGFAAGERYPAARMTMLNL
ncbi:MAG: aldo/keto reductase [Gammaproteobacteria bacterium]|nr:aldo/keto reductase [Gammaproteobacteria bacterium]